MSRCQDAAKKALVSVKSYAPNAEAKWGQEGLDSIFQDKSIHAVAVVLPAQYQVSHCCTILALVKCLLFLYVFIVGALALLCS